MSKALAIAALVTGSVALAGCESSSGSAILGGLGGAAAGAGGYEYHLNNQKTRVEEDLKMDQITRDSLIQ